MNKPEVDPFFEGLSNHSTVKWPKLFATQLEDMTDGERIMELKTMVGGFKMWVEENPRGFADFFKKCEQFSNRVFSGWDEDSKRKFILQDIAGFSYLADFDSKGFLTYEMMRGSPRLVELGVVGYPEIYNHSRKYGPTMDSLSLYLKMDGPSLKSFIFDRNPSC